MGFKCLQSLKDFSHGTEFALYCSKLLRVRGQINVSNHCKTNAALARLVFQETLIDNRLKYMQFIPGQKVTLLMDWAEDPLLIAPQSFASSD